MSDSLNQPETQKFLRNVLNFLSPNNPFEKKKYLST